MKIFTFDRFERAINAHDSCGVHVGGIAQCTSARISYMAIEPGGIVGSHPAPSHQVFFVISGAGRVTDSDDRSMPIAAGQAAHWSPGEVHTTTSESGLTAIVLEGIDLTVFGSDD